MATLVLIYIFEFYLVFRIMVLDTEKLIEFDSPDALIKNRESMFYSMALEAGLV